MKTAKPNQPINFISGVLFVFAGFSKPARDDDARHSYRPRRRAIGLLLFITLTDIPPWMTQLLNDPGMHIGHQFQCSSCSVKRSGLNSYYNCDISRIVVLSRLFTHRYGA